MAGFLLVFVYAWDYSENGRDWDGLCKDGGVQSPIELNSFLTENFTDSSNEYFFVEFKYKETLIVNSNSSSLRGFNYSPKKNFHVFGDFGNIKMNSKTFSSKYFKFHSPSEHTINAVSYPLELQIIHGSSNQTVVVVILFEYSEDDNDFLQDVIRAYYNLVGGKVNLQDSIGGWFAIKDFWYYEGSLSEPPCSEGVKYVINEKPVPATIEQISFFKGILVGNNRDLMPQNSRLVKHFKGLEDKEGFAQRLMAFFIMYLI